MRAYFLIDKSQSPEARIRPDGEHFPRLVCDSEKVAKLQAGDTQECATVWQFGVNVDQGKKLLLIRWRGLDIDYQLYVKPSKLPDGTMSGFDERVEALLRGSIWWSTRPLPRWLQKLGVRLSPDTLTEPRTRAKYLIEHDERLASEPGRPKFGYRTTLDLSRTVEPSQEERRQEIIQFAEAMA